MDYTIKYIDSKGRTSTRKISNLNPYWSKEGTLVFDCFCHNKLDTRTFTVERVVEILDDLGNEISKSALFKDYYVIEKEQVVKKYPDEKFEINQIFEIEYRDSKGAITRRMIMAKFLAISWKNEIKVEAFCYLRNSPKTFSAKSIQRIFLEHGEVVNDPMSFLISFKKAA